MREIKFRGKRVYCGDWVYGSYFYDGKRHYIITDIVDKEHAIYGHYSNKVNLYIVDPETVGQYTGIKDVKSKEIYEGDIVKYRCDGYGWNFINCVIGYVKDEASFYAIHTDEYGNSRSYSLLNSHVAFKVIGNIFQNPELLEVTE